MEALPFWKTKNLNQLFDLVNGFSFAMEDWSDSGLPIIRIQNLNNKLAPYNYFSGNCPIRYRVSDGDLLFSWSGSRGTSFGPFLWNGGDGLLNQHIFNMKPISNAITIQFAFIWLKFILREIEDQAHGSAGLVHITKSELGQFQIPIPEMYEQQKIAEILTTVDNLIEQTQALIDKYTSIKQGMMADLFTRGIDLSGTPETNPNYGQLRPSFEEAPELYKETELGWVPREWDVKCCKDVTQRICVGIVIQPSKYYVAEGVPAFRSANIREEGIDPSGLVFISEQSNALLEKSQVKTGDVLSVRTGYPGTSAVVTKEFDGMNCIDILISTPLHSLSSDFLCRWINSEFGKGQVLKAQGGAAQQHFNVGDMQELKIVLPTSEEQVAIIERSNAAIGKIEKEKLNMNKWRKIKKGLMQDLLTGKVQVTA